MSTIIGVHGYNHDETVEEDSPFREPEGNFPIWERMLERHNFVPMAWFSGIKGRDAFRAWSAGFSNTYAWAYSALTKPATENLLELAEVAEEPVDVICHSLGSRVVLQAIKENATPFRRVLILNGAETIEEAAPIMMASTNCTFLNIAVREDDVLRFMGARFEPKMGRHGCMGNGLPASLRRYDHIDEVVLDDEWDKRWFLQFGWDIKGDGPSFGDHSFSFECEDNWPLYQTFFGQGITW